MALRFLMGAFEAGFTPGVPYLLSFFYKRHELGLRCGLFVSAAPLANAFAGALAYGITSGHPALASWRVLFLAEGLPVCFAAILAWFFVPDSAATARFLTEEEKEVARARTLQQTGETEREGKVQWKELLETLADPKAWFTAVSISIIISNQPLTILSYS
jgi:MFS family permease